MKEFVIQHNLMNEEQLRQVKAAVEKYPHRFVGVIPFSHDITSDMELSGVEYIPYGSTLLMTLAHKRGWTGLSFDPSVFSMKQAYAHRRDMLNNGRVMSVREAESVLREMIGDVFVRPDLDLKHFSGQVIDSVECADWFKDAMSLPLESGSYAMDPHMEVIVSEPLNIQAEWRYFIVGGKVVSGSMYRYKGQLLKKRELDAAVLEEAQQAADGWLPAPNVVMDLALVDDTVKVIEFNCINSSGFYDNDIPAVFDALWNYYKE